VSAGFREIRHLEAPEIGSPLSAEWIFSFFGSNLLPMFISSGGEMSATSLMEKGVISRAFRWSLLQAWGLTFWGRNMVVNIGLSRYGVGQAILWSIVGVDALSKIGFIIADKVFSPKTERAKRLSGLFPVVDDDKLVVRIFSPETTKEDRVSISVLNGLNGVLDIDTKVKMPDGKKSRQMTPDHYADVTRDIRPDPVQISRLQTLARAVQRSFGSMTQGAKDLFTSACGSVFP